MYFFDGPKGQLEIIQKIGIRYVLIVDSTGHRLQVARRIESASTDNSRVDRIIFQRFYDILGNKDSYLPLLYLMASARDAVAAYKWLHSG